MMTLNRLMRAIFVAIVISWGVVTHAQRLVVNSDHADGVYKAEETARWSIHWYGEGETVDTCTFVTRAGGKTEISKGNIVFANGYATLETQLKTPNTVLLEVRVKTKNGGEYRAQGGVVFSPDKVTPSSKRPKDFDAFWKAKIKELNAVPAHPVLEVGESNKPNIAYWKIKMDNIRGTHIQGQVARPIEGKKFPALLIVQWAGVYGLSKPWVTDRASEGWLVLNIEAHDLPIDQPQEFYREQSAGALRDYPAIGNDDRETSYFLRMYLSCYRAAQYLTERADWDGKTLVVMGGSQGGQQTLVTAGIHPQITAALASVPAGCDMLGPDAGRDPGWPKWYYWTKGRDETRVREASRYFDVVNFASRIRCPVLVGIGLIDQTCPPAGILAAMNQVKGAKEIILLPRGEHNDRNDAHGVYNRRCYGDWLTALRQGKPAPIEGVMALEE
ncbi:MAG: acetylxylan esterase [Armatimonadetes bacterium]|nr:acetylxylan esterase [Armatimonadota bacterium]